jgi:hypothetical protein
MSAAPRAEESPSRSGPRPDPVPRARGEGRDLLGWTEVSRSDSCDQARRRREHARRADRAGDARSGLRLVVSESSQRGRRPRRRGGAFPDARLSVERRRGTNLLWPQWRPEATEASGYEVRVTGRRRTSPVLPQGPRPALGRWSPPLQRRAAAGELDKSRRHRPIPCAGAMSTRRCAGAPGRRSRPHKESIPVRLGAADVVEPVLVLERHRRRRAGAAGAVG